MKLTVSGSMRQQGFALPTILLVSIIMLTVLISSIGAAAGSRVALDSQYYNELARQAAESGIARANECLKKSGYKPQWSTEASGTALTPATTCTGVGSAYPDYLVDTSGLRTAFSVDAPNGSGIGSNLKVTGTAELLRTSTNDDGTRDVWRRYEQTMYLRIEPMGRSISCSSYNIGDTGPAGGIIFYKDTATTPNTCYEAAPAGWYSGTAPVDPTAEWGCYNTAIAGADSTAIGAGRQNTTDMLAAGCSPNTGGNRLAATIATNYTGGGKSDWYLPSRFELNQIYLQKSIVGGIADVRYWSSSEYSATNSWYQLFSTGAMYTGAPDKTSLHYVRPIRSFTEEIEPPQGVTCPNGFISVPGSSVFGTSNFCVAKYEAKNVGGTAVSTISGTPFVNITQPDAMAAAANACSGCHLITEAEWLTIAHNVLNVNSNWTGGSVGSGSLYIGHTDNSPASPLAASGNDNDGYFGTGNTNDTQRRTLTLSNGEVIWDLSGNVTEWTAGQTTGGQPGTTAHTSYGWRNWNTMEGTGTISPNPFPSFGTPAAVAWSNSANGIGMVWSDSDDVALRGFLRGGSHTYGATTPGVFVLYLGYAPTQTFTNIGFRVAR